MDFKKFILICIWLVILVLSIGVSSAIWNVEDMHEMTGTIVAKDVGGKSIDYLIEINGTICYLSSSDQPYEEFNVGDNVTLNGTFNDKDANVLASDFGEEYEGRHREIVLNHIVVDQHTYGQMRLTSDVDNQYYKQLQ